MFGFKRSFSPQPQFKIRVKLRWKKKAIEKQALGLVGSRTNRLAMVFSIPALTVVSNWWPATSGRRDDGLFVRLGGANVRGPTTTTKIIPANC